MADGREPVVKIIVDSGAYSAWRLDKSINLPEYCDYIDRNRDWIANYINLDVINPGNREAAAITGFDNLLYMRKRGLDPMPVFHAGEDFSWLYRMLDLGCRYIGLASSSLPFGAQRDDWYELVWSHLVNSDGLPLVRVHALGEARYNSLVKFPWASADSTTWIYRAQRAGSVRMQNGCYVGMRNDGASSGNAPDIDDLDSLNRDELETLAAASGIKDVIAAFKERGREAWVLRLYLTSFFYLMQARRVNKACPIHFSSPGFFGANNQTLVSAIHLPEQNFYLVIGNNDCARVVCAFAKYHNVLASYYYLVQNESRAIPKDWVYDPIGTCRSDPEPIAGYVKILEKYLEKQ